jgi:hypothetical protein
MGLSATCPGRKRFGADAERGKHFDRRVLP